MFVYLSNNHYEEITFDIYINKIKSNISIFEKNNQISNDQGFDLNMSRSDISSYLSISREEISRILQKLENSGLIFVKNRHIALLNIPKLNAICFDD
jgi:CRP-like cAMP-binding protein